ncbi:hypothetical protein ACI796_02480 [Geodermatophilus sp. SYSU D00525]
MFSAGVFAAIPFWHAAGRLRDASARLWAIAYSGWGVAFILAGNLLSDDRPGRTAGAGPEWLNDALAFVVLVLLVVACFRLQRLRSHVYERELALIGADPAMTRALEARRRRDEARSLFMRDPALARELGIGRPDLGRGYDDGGLVDINTAPAAVIASRLELDTATAHAIVDARSVRGGYYALSELFIDVALPVHAQERLNERTVL